MIELYNSQIECGEVYKWLYLEYLLQNKQKELKIKEFNQVKELILNSQSIDELRWDSIKNRKVISGFYGNFRGSLNKKLINNSRTYGENSKPILSPSIITDELYRRIDFEKEVKEVELKNIIKIIIEETNEEYINSLGLKGENILEKRNNLIELYNSQIENGEVYKWLYLENLLHEKQKEINMKEINATKKLILNAQSVRELTGDTIENKGIISDFKRSFKNSLNKKISNNSRTCGENSKLISFPSIITDELYRKIYFEKEVTEIELKNIIKIIIEETNEEYINSLGLKGENILEKRNNLIKLYNSQIETGEVYKWLYLEWLREERINELKRFVKINKDLCKKYKLTYNKVKHIPSLELYAKINLLVSINESLMINEEINHIFNMCDINMQSTYGISLEELINKYSKNIEEVTERKK